MWRRQREFRRSAEARTRRFTNACPWRASADEPLIHPKAVGPPAAGAVHVPAAAVLPRCHTGRVLEEVLAEVRSARVLPTYDFVDVVSAEEACGWQVKSTKAATALTWKRAKLPNATELINASMESEAACQELGNAIIGLCNEHAQASLADYELEEIGYARLILHPDGQVNYFEKLLCSSSKPHIFDPADFSWHWSDPKQTVRKEQLPALQGMHRRTKRKWWAWHGRGENQLHFAGESAWWPDGGRHSLSFHAPSAEQKLSIDDILNMLANMDSDA